MACYAVRTGRAVSPGHFDCGSGGDGLSAVGEGLHRLQVIFIRAWHSDLRLILVHFEAELIIRHRHQFVAHAEKPTDRYNTQGDAVAILQDQVVQAANLLILIVVNSQIESAC